MPSRLHRWTPRPAARLTMVCIPHAGGSATVYRELARRLPADVELAAAELPGRGARTGEPFAASVPDIVQEVSDTVIRDVRGRFVLYGHSMGALLALEVARTMTDSGRGPAALLVAAGEAPVPGRPWFTGPGDLGDDRAAAPGDPRGRPADAPPGDEAVAMAIAAMRADAALMERHRHTEGAPLGCAVRCYGGLSDPLTSREGLARWRRENPRDFRCRLLPGGHFFPDEHPGPFLARLSHDLTEITSARKRVP